MLVLPDSPHNTPELLKQNLYQAINETVSSIYPVSAHRERAFSLETLTCLFLTMDGGSIAKELHAAGIDASVSAFVQRRKKIINEHFEYLLKNFNKLCAESCPDSATFKGRHVIAVDGTCVNLDRDTKAPTFMQNDSNLRGYNQLHVTPLYDVLNKTYLDCVIQPQPEQDEIGALIDMLYWNFDLPLHSIIVGDRGFESYNVFTHFTHRKFHDFLIRVKQENSAMKLIRNLPMEPLDTDVQGEITTRQTNEDKEKGRIFIQTHANPDRTYSENTRAGRWDFCSPYFVKFRVVRFQLSTGEYETLATSLPREEFSPDDLKMLYHARWGIETAFREMKYNLGIVHLHGKSMEFAKQEILASMIFSNFCSRIISQAVLEKNNRTHEYAANIKMATYLCKQFLRTPKADGDWLLHEIAGFVEPIRPGRSDERKIQPKSFRGFVYRVPA